MRRNEVMVEVEGAQKPTHILDRPGQTYGGPGS
jgi:hypothetical protein